MNTFQIMTERPYQSWPSWAVVYECEDIMSDVLNAEIIDMHKGLSGTFEASGISVGENLTVTLTTELFLDSEPEAKPATAVRRLALDRF